MVPTTTRAACRGTDLRTPRAEALLRTMATSAVRDTVTRCTPGTVVGGMNAVVRLPGNRVAERQHIRLSSWRQGVKQQAAAHPTMVTSESLAICESGQGGGGQAVRRGVAKGGASRVRGEERRLPRRSSPPQNKENLVSACWKKV